MEKNKNSLAAVSSAIEKVIVWILTVLTIILVVFVFVQVLCRFVLNVSFVYGEEGALLCFTWIVFLGTSIGIKEGTHFIVDIFPDSLPKKWDKRLAVIVHILVILASIILIVFGVKYAISGLSRFSYTTGLPMIIYYIAGPISGVLTLFFAIERIIGVAKETGEER